MNRAACIERAQWPGASRAHFEHRADDESLLVAWLNALICEMAVRRMLFSRFQVVIDGQHLRASARGEPVSVPRHRPAVEIKGATFTGLRVAAFDAGGVVSAGGVGFDISRGVAEEAPGACKDVTAVVDAAEAAGLARKVARLEPLVSAACALSFITSPSCPVRIRRPLPATRV